MIKSSNEKRLLDFYQIRCTLILINMATEDIKIGISGTSTTKVCKENCASLMGSGALDVFATPAVVAYMEMAACYAVNDLLEEGLSTVGTKIDIAHIKASPIGETITAKATLKEIDGRRLVFDVTASDSKGEIANGTHERFIIKVDKFLANGKQIPAKIRQRI